MRRVFHIITHFDLGGAEAVALNIAKSRNTDFEYHLVEVMRGQGQWAQHFIAEMEESGIHYHRALLPVVFHFHYVAEKLLACLFPLRFLLLFLKYRPAIVHVHTEMPDLGIFVFFKLFPWLEKRCQLVRTIHNTVLWTGMKSIGAKVEAEYRRARANIAISTSVARCYEEAYGERPPIIYNGVAEKAQRPYDGRIEGRINVLFAGRLEKQKGITTLAEILRMMKNDERYAFHIFGAGSEATLLHEFADDENIIVRPPMYGISSFLGAFDYMLMPSLHEGLSIMAIEASMAGLPTIINDCAGLNETLPPDWPLKVTNNDIAAYHRLFTEVLPTADRDSLGRTARNFAQGRFSIEQMQTAYERAYDERLG